MTRTLKRCKWCHDKKEYCGYPIVKKRYSIPTEDVKVAITKDTPILLRLIHGIPATRWDELKIWHFLGSPMKDWILLDNILDDSKNMTNITWIEVAKNKRPMDTCGYHGRCDCNSPNHRPFFSDKIPDGWKNHLTTKSWNKSKGMKKQYNKYLKFSYSIS